MDSDRLVSAVDPLAGPPSVNTTPAGLQSMAQLRRRRRAFLVLNLVTYALLLVWAGMIAHAGGWTLVDSVMVICFAMTTPWVVLGFWNSAIALWLMHGHRNGVAAAVPFIDRIGDGAGPVAKTAVLMLIRNEQPERALERLRATKASIDRTGEGDAFDYFILSDTDQAEIAGAEEAAVGRWKAAEGENGPARIHYRRRVVNTGYKAGNVRDFCEQWGDAYNVMLVLDADSLMGGSAIVDMARVMQAHPRIGILQGLVVGMPANSFFARVFQFGMRHGLRPYTLGQAWWSGDCGPFWGHNAMVRIKPFQEACTLPELPGSGPLSGQILSHDQVEAVLMRRAGFEVRVLPIEMESWEENPPTITEFIKRDVRWCQGNLQYLNLLSLPGLQAVSRFQLVWAILMYAGVPAATVMIVLLPFAAREAHGVAAYPIASLIALYLVYIFLLLSPKLVGLVEEVADRRGLIRHGGTLRFLGGAVVETVFSFLLAAVTSFRVVVFMVGLLFGRGAGWTGQTRDASGLSWATALSAFWPQTLFGVLLLGALYWVSPAVLLWSLPFTLGYVTAVPFAVVTASPALGRWAQRVRLCGLPEEFNTPKELQGI